MIDADWRAARCAELRRANSRLRCPPAPVLCRPRAALELSRAL
jgi:hypothetical protein